MAGASLSSSAQDLTLGLPPEFPAGAYTPHGYLDNPWHSMVANRSGVLRSAPPLGMGWWLRSFRGAYGTGMRGHINYVSLLQMSVACDDRESDLRLMTPGDFEQHGIALVSQYHSKHLLSYDFAAAGLRFAFRYFLPREHALACQIEIENPGESPRTVFVHATHIYGLWETRWWGADGVATFYRDQIDGLVSAIWAYGDYFALGADKPGYVQRPAKCARKATGSFDEWQRWLRQNDLGDNDTATLRGPGPMYAVATYRFDAPPRGMDRLLVCLTRGPSETAAMKEMRIAWRAALPTARRQLAEDAEFWSRCPRLEGDWPATWQRGWVYDWETLRMNVRRPLGTFQHPWDAMQIHSPRSVLGEASVDMLMLSYADPALAQSVLYGTFADAPAPNVPCCREDGSMNMIAADGEACGTAPSWCFPFHVIRAIYGLHNGVNWIKQLYPHLKSYLEWWLAHRTDAHGWFHCHCDWESGQDGSRRFPEAEGGAADHVRTVDVEASVAEAFRNMAEFAACAGHPEDVPRWTELATQRTAAVQGMFVDGWFHDFDTRSNVPINVPDYLDIMMLAPLTCGVATPEQIAALRPKIAHFRENPHPWLEWPSYFLAYAEAAWTAGAQRIAAEATADVADRIYPRLDARGPRFADGTPTGYRLPGVACEFWPIAEDLEPGGEGYGWGATLPLQILRNIVGFREAADAAPAAVCILAPALPARLMVPGHSYGARNLHFQGVTFSVRFDVLSPERLCVRIECAASVAEALENSTRDADRTIARVHSGAAGTTTAEGGAAKSCVFECANGTALRLCLGGLALGSEYA